jgi:RNA-directed DNA polymerase
MLEGTRWSDLDWTKVRTSVTRKQNLMYQASLKGDVERVRQLQRDILRDDYAKLLAVRRVTAENTGRYTPGVDGETIHDPNERMKLARALILNDQYQAKPLKRVYIPKSNGKLRPLGIPTVRDRAMQALVKLALEPEWEAKFSADAYGFRPGRSAHDATMAVWHALKMRREAIVLDADIKGCFDHLNHDHILKCLEGISSNILRAIREWFKCGYVVEGHLHPTQEGTPQGGVLSPLLANIGLWGIDFELHHALIGRNGNRKGFRPSYNYTSSLRSKRREHAPEVQFIQYADDFVVICSNEETDGQVMDVLPAILATRGLELSSEKTRKVLFTERETFKFLGFEFARWKSGRHDKTHKVTFYADPDKVYGFNRKIRQWTRAIRLFENQETLTKKGDYFKRMVNGWLNYYKWAIDASHAHRKLRWLLRETLYRAYEDVHRHRATKSAFVENYVANTERRGRTVERFKIGRTEFGVFDISTAVRWAKVQGARSPYDGDDAYWSSRNATLSGEVAKKLYRKQNGLCPTCNQMIRWNDPFQRHHIDRDRQNNRITNFQLVHQDCHRRTHSENV